jgi:hypothetical protein
MASWWWWGEEDGVYGSHGIYDDDHLDFLYDNGGRYNSHYDDDDDDYGHSRGVEYEDEDDEDPCWGEEEENTKFNPETGSLSAAGTRNRGKMLQLVAQHGSQTRALSLE